MEQLEKVEKLREKTGVTYEEAKKALEENQWDLLDAIVALENQGKIKGPQMSAYSTDRDQFGDFEKAAQDYEESSSRMTFGQAADKFLKWVGGMIKKGSENFFEVKKDGKDILSIPVLVLVIVFLVAFWLVSILLVVGLFCGFQYSFRGNIAKTIDINSACDKASKTCENIKKDFTGDE